LRSYEGSEAYNKRKEYSRNKQGGEKGKQEMGRIVGRKDER
jgi:hypothetical protein